MVHGAPDYHKSIVIPPVDVDVQDLGVYPARSINFDRHDEVTSGDKLLYTVPEGKILYISHAELEIVNPNYTYRRMALIWMHLDDPFTTYYLARMFAPANSIVYEPFTYPIPYKGTEGWAFYLETMPYGLTAYGGIWGHLADV